MPTDPRALAGELYRAYHLGDVAESHPIRRAHDALLALVEECRVLQINLGANLQSGVQIARKYEVLLGLLRDANAELWERSLGEPECPHCGADDDAGEPHEPTCLIGRIDAALRGVEKPDA